MSGFSVNVGKSQITQTSKVRDLGVIFDQFSTLMILLLRLYIGNIIHFLSLDSYHTNIHALISCRLDYRDSIMYNVPKNKTVRL